ncbi:FabD/lysophospholipase-like protein [Meira miltonrushii]|uniref:Lysophospholipase n=1 Tax=Meira miltonrushii TaxID=1280837 RepID=A0A316V8W2_9BASI|nr:FabD/lysophospholipase-like protein [Meira miltonrushii]PWN32623.1 FabD/lysophospholipase-like protein [Meira miltonrushii]
MHFVNLYSLLSILFVSISIIEANVLPVQNARALELLDRRSPSDYAPKRAQCPSNTLARSSKLGINPDEKAYVSARQPNAQTAFSQWINSLNAGFGNVDSSTTPVLSLASSGGGFRAMLTGAGVHQALDSREQNASKLKGLYQSLIYESGLSGGSWLLGSIMGNNWQTITQIKEEVWYRTLPGTPLLPDQSKFLFSYADVLAAITAKKVSGYDPTLIDVYGRLLGYSLLEQSEGGIKQTLSSITSQSNYANHNYPFPIVTTVQSQAAQQCSDDEIGATQFEYSPLEFGSWDSAIASFIPTNYTGSIVGNDGVPSCITGFDNLGFIMGASSDIFPEFCASVPKKEASDAQKVYNFTQSVLHQIQKPTFRDVYAAFPDSFDKQALSASAYPPERRLFPDKPTELYMMDGGFSGQVNPIWPFLHRQIDVLFVEDSSSDTQYNFPNGSSIYETYTQAQAKGLSRMPTIPTPAEFVQKGYNTRPTFFGCDQGSDVMTIVYLPNNAYVYPSNTSTYKLSYTKPEIDGMLANGQAVATYNGTAGYDTCVACVTLKKTSASLPSACSKCFTDYCA